MRLYQCPAGYYMVRDELYPEQDTCVQCSMYEYLLAPITVSNMSIKCSKCPVGGYCPGNFKMNTFSPFLEILLTQKIDALAWFVYVYCLQVGI
jgi:hypothetical protein